MGTSKCNAWSFLEMFTWGPLTHYEDETVECFAKNIPPGFGDGMLEKTFLSKDLRDEIVSVGTFHMGFND